MSSSDEFDRYEAALRGCLHYIDMQISMIRAEHNGALPPAATDSFGLGYLFGFVDGWMQAFSVESESLRATATGLVLQNVMDSDVTPEFSQGRALMHSGETAFIEGMTRGGTDAFQKIRSGLAGNASPFPPMTLAEHVHEQSKGR